MRKTVLLARPHPFLVSEMKPWLESIGYGVVRSDSFADLKVQAMAASAAVISLAVTSPMGETAEEVYRTLWSLRPDLPVVFAALRTFEQAETDVLRIAGRVGVKPRLLRADIAGTSATDPQVSHLYLSKDDLANPAALAGATSWMHGLLR